MLNRGNVMGKPLTLSPAKWDATRPGYHGRLAWGSAVLELDTLKLPARVVRALPAGILTPGCTGEKWEPFIREAISAGII